MSDNPIKAAMNLPPKQAVAFLRDQGIAVTENWYDLWEEAKAHAKTITGETKKDLIADVFNQLEDKMLKGGSSQAITTSIADNLAKNGWYYGYSGGADAVGSVTESARRLRLIVKQNAQTAYMAARWKRFADNKENRPYLQYVAVMDASTRYEHAALQRKVFQIDDEIWDVIYPPNGFNCRCRVRSLSDADMKRKGLQTSRAVTHKSTQSVGKDDEGNTLFKNQYHVGIVGGKTMMKIADGFSSNVGKAHYQSFVPSPDEITAHNVHLTKRLADNSKILPDDLAPDDYAKAFLAEFGIDDIDGEAVFTDVTGEAIAINKQLLLDKKSGKMKTTKQGRGQYLPLLADAVKQPDEIWLDWEYKKGKKDKETGEQKLNWTLKRRYLRVVDLGDNLFGLSVVSWRDGLWSGSTVFQIDKNFGLAGQLEYLNKQRKGKKIYDAIAAKKADVKKTE